MKRKFQFIALNVLIAFQDMASLPPRRPRQAPRPHCGRHGGGDGGIQHPMYTGSVCASFRRSTAATAGAESRLAALWRDRRLVGHPAHGQQGTSCTQRARQFHFQIEMLQFYSAFARSGNGSEIFNFRPSSGSPRKSKLIFSST